MIKSLLSRFKGFPCYNSYTCQKENQQYWYLPQGRHTVKWIVSFVFSISWSENRGKWKYPNCGKLLNICLVIAPKKVCLTQLLFLLFCNTSKAVNAIMLRQQWEWDFKTLLWTLHKIIIYAVEALVNSWIANCFLEGWRWRGW